MRIHIVRPGQPPVYALTYCGLVMYRIDCETTDEDATGRTCIRSYNMKSEKYRLGKLT